MSRGNDTQSQNLGLLPELDHASERAGTESAGNVFPGDELAKSSSVFAQTDGTKVKTADSPLSGLPTKPSITSPSPFLSVRQVASRHGVSTATVWRWVKERSDFPQPIKLGSGTTRWMLDDLIEFEARLIGKK